VLTVRACDDLDRTLHLSYGDYPAREYLKHITGFSRTHIWMWRSPRSRPTVSFVPSLVVASPMVSLLLWAHRARLFLGT